MSITTSSWTLRQLAGLAILLWANNALAFTIIEIPDEEDAPGASIADAISLGAQFRPLAAALRSHAEAKLRRDASREAATGGDVFAHSGYADTASDASFIEVANHGGGQGILQSVWLSSSLTDFDNDFSRTRFDGKTHLLLAGLDITVSERYVWGIAFGYETTTIDTEFNSGGQEIDGFNLSPYFAYLLSDTWSVDVSLSLGSYDTKQTRGEVAVLPGPVLVVDNVDSDFSSERQFLASNLTYSAPRGNWFLTGWLGLLAGDKEQDDYTESDATEVEGQELDIERWYLGGEAAYGHDVSETYFGLIYEKDQDVNEIEFAAGEQPENDDDSVLLTVGWRYFGSDVTADIELSTRLGQDDTSESSIATTLRIDL